MRRYLLDTCAMGDLINRRKGVHERARAARLGGARLGTCIPVLGELFFGIEFSQTRAENRARLIRAITGLSLALHARGCRGIWTTCRTAQASWTNHATGRHAGRGHRAHTEPMPRCQ